MMKGYRGSKGAMKLILLLLAGGLVGSALSDVLTKAIPIAVATQKIGLQPTTLDLGFMQFTIGLLVVLGPGTALGLILGYLAYRKI